MKERKQNNYGQDDLDMELANLPDEEELRKQRRQQQKAREERKLQQAAKEEEIPKKQKSKKKKTKRITNKEITRVTYMFVTLFLVMIGYLVYFNLVKSKDVINSVYNIRQDILADRVVRGKILDSEGNILAQTVTADDGTETREYPYGDMFTHTVGYSVKGKSGVESIQNFNLLTSNATLKVKVPDDYTGDVMGDLNKRRGRVLGMDPVTGGYQIVTADIPMTGLFGYCTTLRSMTGGRGTYSYEFARYEQAPADVQEKEIKARAEE